jgi:hypothetical protein
MKQVSRLFCCTWSEVRLGLGIPKWNRPANLVLALPDNASGKIQTLQQSIFIISTNKDRGKFCALSAYKLSALFSNIRQSLDSLSSLHWPFKLRNSTVQNV